VEHQRQAERDHRLESDGDAGERERPKQRVKPLDDLNIFV